MVLDHSGEPDQAMEKFFDLSEEYDSMLHKGLRLSGEDRLFFLAGRVTELEKRLPPEHHPKAILDFGCGIGDATALLSRRFPGATVVGSDTSERALEHARRVHGSGRVSFIPMAELAGRNDSAVRTGR